MSWADAPCWTGPAPPSTPSRSAPKEGENTGPNPTDRGKPGSKLHLPCDHQGLPLTCAVSAANVNDIEALQPLVRGIPAVRSRRGPRRRRPAKLHGDKAYHCRLRYDRRTIDYMRRRSTEGLSKKDVLHCLKHFIAREVFHDIKTDRGLA